MNFSFIFCFVGILNGYSEAPSAQRPFEHPHAHDAIEGNAHVAWESRYFSEGRDALDGDSLFTGSIELGWKHLTGGIWYGESPDQRYDELQLSVGVAQSVGDFEFYGAYTHFRFRFDDSHDNEFGTGVAWSGLPMDVELAVDLYHSFEADGFFAEISANRGLKFTDKIDLNFGGVFGINQGYVSDGHDGANHVAAFTEISFALSESVFITAHTTYSWGLGRDRALLGDAQLIDFFHGGVGLRWSF